MSHGTLRGRASLLAFVSAIAFASPVAAKEAVADAAPAAANSDDSAAPGEIIVTAQKRSESVQNVPISIAAFNDAALTKANVATVLDLGRIATNFQTVRSSNTGSTRIGIRGLGSLANTLIEPSVAVFVDGIYVPRSGAVLGAFLDMEGVEVLRGPQGTLFGRNASAGALSLRGAMPKNEFSGMVSGEVGSFDRYKLSGNVNLPLGENVSMRLAGMGQWYKGPWINRLDGKRYGGSNDMSFRGTIKADLGNLNWVLRADYTKLDGDGVANFDFDATSVSDARLAFLQTNFNGGGDTNLTDRYMNQSMATGLVDKNYGVSSTASLDIGGGATLKLINSYRVWDNNQLDGDIIFLPVSLASRVSLFNSKSQNHELQFISPEKQWMNGMFDMVAGLYYFTEDFKLAEKFNLGSSWCNVIIPAASRPACNTYVASTGGVDAAVQNVFQNVKSIAAYGQGNIHLSDQLTLTLGGRWTQDKKNGTYAQVSSPYTLALRAPESLTFPGISESRFTYRVSLNYKPSDNVLAFANFSTGYKSGGYNSGGGNASLTVVDTNGNFVSTRRLFNRETVKNYELGIKSTWLDRALKANLTLYRMDIAGFQDRAFDGISFIVRNAGSLRQQGFEFDLTMAPTRDFSVTGSFAYLDSKFTDYTNAANLPGLTGTQDITGKPNSFSPAWSGNLAVDWSGDLGSSGMRWALNGNVSFVSSQYVGTSLDANPQSLADGYALLGARLTLSGRDDRWSVSAFARNIGDVNYRSIAVYQPLSGPLGLNNGIFSGSSANRIQKSEPRTFGATATFRF